MSSNNDHLLLVCGESSTGKSVSLSNLSNVLYLNCESGKRLPFKPKNFKEVTITDPYQVYEAFEWAENQDDIKTIVIDGLNYLMDMYESVHVLTASNTMQSWSNYAQFFKNLMQKYVASSSKSVVFTAHTKSALNDKAMVMETKVPIKGSLSNQGVESYFSCIVSTKKVTIDDLTDYDNDLLTYTDRERALGFKYVFQTQITKDTVNERMRSPMGLFDDKETFINNDVTLVLNRLNEYYA
ncbi:AAA family ATPase [Moraxella sp. ZY200743]|uniref:AAA family ATPase n=1 Tax=Moraxella sp. ZY200743 TaxID=2911970 RepID=UPI003D7F0EAC